MEVQILSTAPLKNYTGIIVYETVVPVFLFWEILRFMTERMVER